MSEELQKLHEHREGILLAEIGALLHDVGKMTNIQMEHHSLEKPREWPHDDGYKALVDSPSQAIRLSQAARSNLSKPAILNYLIRDLSPTVATSLPTAAKEGLLGSEVSLLGEQYTLAELTMLATPGFAGHKNRQHLLLDRDGWLAAALGVCHSEAHHDKQDSTGEGVEQSIKAVYKSSPFGYEASRDMIYGEGVDSQDERLNRLPITPDTLRSPATLRHLLAAALGHGLGDTRRPINEITLADWALTVAALFKPVLAQALIEGSKAGIRQWKSRTEIDHDLRWRLLRVNVDVLGLYARAITIADLLSYRRAVEEAWCRVKHIVEEEYPLGNEVYRDTTGIYFTYPDLDLIPGLAERIRAAVEGVEPELAPRIAVGKGRGEKPADQLKTLLAKQHEQARHELAFPFGPGNASERWAACWRGLSKGQWEVCPICRLRPVREKEKECKHCHDRRLSRIQPWLRSPSETIWLDEIADHNGRLALIVGKFGLDDWLSGNLVETMLVQAVEGQPDKCRPKNPSPARLRRVWRTTQAFWDETVVKTILADHPYAAETRAPALRQCRVAIVPDEKERWDENVPYDGTIDGRPISLLWRKDPQRFTSISNLQMAAGKARTVGELAREWKGLQVRLAPADSPRDTRPFTVQEVIPEGDDMGRYAPSLPLVTSPDQFLALVPAHDALDLAQRIADRYGIEFARVRNRLPLLLGLVFFQRKLPLQAVIDTARRMVAQVKLEEECQPLTAANDGCLTFDNGVTWTFPLKMGDGETCDRWYPYVALEEGDAHERDLYFTHKSRTWVHAKHLQAGDTVRVYPSRFTYTFLEDTAQRFLFDPDKDVLLLEEVARLKKMWQRLRERRDVTDTKLQGVGALLEAKRCAWRVDEAPCDGDERRAFRELAEATLAREELPGVTPDDVLDGRFQRCLHLYLHILRARAMDKAEPWLALDTTQPTQGWSKGES